MKTDRRPFATFDIETDPFKHGRAEKPFLCGFYDGRSYRDWYGPDCVERCWKEAMSKFDGIIYAHAGGKFDFKFLLPLLPKKPLEVFCVASRIGSIKTARAEFRDSYLLIPVPLAAYGKKEIDIRKLEANRRQNHLPEIREYLKTDCYSLYSMLTEFREEYGIGMTLAGRTFNVLREQFGLKTPHANPTFDENYRRFYYGGRVQFWELGHLDGAFDVFDINSAYPWAMQFDHVSEPSFELRERLPRDEDKLKVGFVEFVGTATGLPWRSEDGSLQFTERTGEFTVSGWEFLAALKLGKVKVDELVAFHSPEKTQSFKAFVDHFYRRKKDANTPGERLFAKLILNSCYGRFALNAAAFRDVTLCEFGEDPNTETSTGWTLASDLEEIGLSIWERPTRVHRNSFFNVATAASITGCVRAFLMESLAKCGRVVYCDTDSIICQDGSGLRVGTGLGEWKREGRVRPGGAWIAGKKLYALRLVDGKWKTAAKGVDLTPAQICAVAEGKRRKSRLDAPTFSLFSGQRWITRTVSRADLRTKKRSK